MRKFTGRMLMDRSHTREQKGAQVNGGRAPVERREPAGPMPAPLADANWAGPKAGIEASRLPIDQAMDAIFERALANTAPDAHEAHPAIGPVASNPAPRAPDSVAVAASSQTGPHQGPEFQTQFVDESADLPGMSELERKLSPAQVIEKIKLHAIGGIFLFPSTYDGFIFCGKSATPELAGRATLGDFWATCKDNYNEWSLSPKTVYFQTDGDDLVVCMVSRITGGQLGLGTVGQESSPVLITFVMPVGLKENLRDALIDERNFAVTFLREIAPFFEPDGERASRPGVRDSIFLQSDFSTIIIIADDA